MKEIEKKKNGLTLVQGKTQTGPGKPPGMLSIAEIKDLKKLVANKFEGEPEYAVFYLDYGIRFAKWQSNTWEFHDKKPLMEHLQLARIFNPDRELKIWQSGNHFAYRLRIDTPDGDDFAIDAEQHLWGTTAKHQLGDTTAHSQQLPTGWTCLTEDRGVELIVPLPITSKPGNSRPLAYVKTRNYMAYLPVGEKQDNGDRIFAQASYIDSRFVALNAFDLKENDEDE